MASLSSATGAISTGDQVETTPATPPVVRWWSWRPTRAWWVETARFLAVGGVSFVVDMGLLNLLTYGPGHLLEHKAVTAKIIATVVATLVSWLGNRYWTFSAHRSSQRGREMLIYGVINGLAALIPSVTLYIALYWLGMGGQLVVNVATVIGIGVGTVLRYVGYKLWVFTAR